MADTRAQIASNQAAIQALIKEMEALRTDVKMNELVNVSTDYYNGQAALAPRKVLQGHQGKIYALDWGNDESTVLSAAQDGSLIVWNALHNHKLNLIMLRCCWVMSCAISPNNGLTASGGLDNDISIYQLPEEASYEDIGPYKTLEEHQGYISDAVFLSNEQLISASGDGRAILWDVANCDVVHTFKGHENDVMAVDVIPNSTVFLTGSCDDTVKMWDHRDRKSHVRTFPGHTKDVNSVSVSPAGNFFCSGSDDGTIIVHDIRSYGPVQQYRPNGDLEMVTSVAFARSSKTIFAGYDSPARCLAWDTLTATSQQLSNPTTHRVSCLGVNTVGNALCTGSWDTFLRIYA